MRYLWRAMLAPESGICFRSRRGASVHSREQPPPVFGHRVDEAVDQPQAALRALLEVGGIAIPAARIGAVDHRPGLGRDIGRAVVEGTIIPHEGRACGNV